MRRARAQALLAATGVLLVLSAPAAAVKPRHSVVVPLAGSFGGGTTFPERSLALSLPSRMTLSASRVTVTENGRPVSGLTVTPLTQAQAGDAGIVVVIDQSPSMRGAPLAQAMAAARGLAAQRAGQEQLGVVTFDATPNVILPLTADSHKITRILGSTPWIGPGTQILPAVNLGLQMLAKAKVAAGGVILLTDGDDRERPSAPTPQQVANAAAAIGVPIFSVGIKDSAYQPALLQNLARWSGGGFVPANVSQLPQVFKHIETGLDSRYLVRYRSTAAPGAAVAVRATVTGVHGAVQAAYRAPVPPAPPAAPRRTAPAAPKPRPIIVPTVQDVLMTWPSFAPPHQAPVTRAAASPRGVLPLAIGAGALIGLAFALLFGRSRARKPARQRVQGFIDSLEVLGADTLQDRTPSRGLMRLFVRRRWWPDFLESIDVARLKRSPGELVNRAAVTALILAVGLTLLLGTPLLGLPILVVWPWFLRTLVARQARRQRTVFNEQLPAHLQDLAGAMRAGRSIVGAFAAVAEVAAEPMHGEFERVVSDDQLGRSLDESLMAIAARMQSEDMEQVALICSLNRQSGSNVAEALDRVAEGSRDRADLVRELRALTGQAKLSSWVLTGLPILVLIGLTLIAPKYEKPMYTTPVGIALLVISIGMVAGGWRTMQAIVNVEA